MKLRISPALKVWLINRLVFLGFALIIAGFTIAYIYTDNLETELAKYKRMYEQGEKEKWSLLMRHNEQNRALQEKIQRDASEKSSPTSSPK